MKKYVFIYCGYEPLTDEIKDAWGNWFTSIREHLVDSGNPFGPGLEITHNGTQTLPLAKDSLAGYSIINAGSLEEAHAIAQTCPIITSIRIYEAMPM